MAKVKSRIAAPKVRKPPSRTAVVTKAATQASRTYVAKRPDTRVPAMLLMLLYPLGQLGYLSAWSPLWLGLASPLVAVAAWVALHRSYGDCGYTRTATVSLGLVPGWLAVASVTGVMHLRVLVCYSVAAVALWVVYARSEVLTERRERRKAQIDWAKFLPKLDLEGAGIRESSETRLGRRHVIDVLGTKHTAHGLARSDLAARWAAQMSIGKDRVTVLEDHVNARQIFVEERTQNPWDEPNGHPTLDPTSEWTLPAVRSIHDGPLEVGADPTTGRMLGLEVYSRKEGAKHVMWVAGTGGGKTVGGHCLLERLTACTDVLVWAIDITSGALPSIWAEALDWGAGVRETTEAMRILRAAKKVIEERSAASGGRNHNATAEAPYIQVVIDEAGKLLGHSNYNLANDARDLVGWIDTQGRRAAVGLAYVSQRGSIQHAGTMDIKASADIRVCGRVTQTSEMNHVLPDWQETGAMDMSKYAQGYPGVVIVQAGSNPWTAGRTFDLSDFDAVEALARRRGAPSARLEPAIAAALGEPYANRRHPAFVAAVPAPTPEETYMDATEREFKSITGHLADIDGAVSELDSMQVPAGEELPMADLIAARAAEEAENRKAEIPGPLQLLVPAMLTSVAEQGQPGLSRANMVRMLGESLKMSPRTVERWLRVMVDQGLIVRQGSTSNAVYVLPEPSA